MNKKIVLWIVASLIIVLTAIVFFQARNAADKTDMPAVEMPVPIKGDNGGNDAGNMGVGEDSLEAMEADLDSIDDSSLEEGNISDAEIGL